jgi:hypothetical protein
MDQRKSTWYFPPSIGNNTCHVHDALSCATLMQSQGLAIGAMGLAMSDPLGNNRLAAL